VVAVLFVGLILGACLVVAGYVLGRTVDAELAARNEALDRALNIHSKTYEAIRAMTDAAKAPK
jgi:hypothetical protein